MKDLTQGPIRSHILAMSIPMMIGMVIQIFHYLVDLYFISQLGGNALAGFGAAGNVNFLVLALTQVIAVSTVALIAQYAGSSETQKINLVINQSLLMAGIGALAILFMGISFGDIFITALTASQEVAEYGIEYLYWALPGLALQFITASLASSLRGVGVTSPTMVVQLITVLANLILSPILIAGWFTGKPLGVAGAALATSISVMLGVVLIFLYVFKNAVQRKFHLRELAPCYATLKSMFKIGLPAGGEYFMMFVFTAFVYFIIRDFGSDAQAGFSIAARVMQLVFLPAVAIGLAIPAVAGQNFGANLGSRVRETVKEGMLLEISFMLLVTMCYQIHPLFLITYLTDDESILMVAGEYMQIASLNFVASGVIFTCSGIFQALGNTIPPLLCTFTRFVTFALPLLVMSTLAGFELKYVWYLSVVTVAIQALMSFVLVKRELNKKVHDPLQDEGMVHL